jgi:hypothetical protein
VIREPVVAHDADEPGFAAEEEPRVHGDVERVPSRVGEILVQIAVEHIVPHADERRRGDAPQDLSQLLGHVHLLSLSHPLTPPAAMPATKYFCSATKTTTMAAPR